MLNDGYIRSNTNPGAILNTDNSGLEAYKRQRHLMHNLVTHENRLKKVEESMDDIKNMLKILVEKQENK